MSRKELIKIVFLKTLPVMSGYIVLGFGFGMLLEDSGYGLPWALAMSVFIYAGSMQYVAVSLLTSGASLIAAALTTLMVNARHLFYGISMIDIYKDAGRKKPYLIFALTDETYSLVCTGETPEGCDPHLYRFLISGFNQCYWVIGSTAGSLIGSALNFNTAGISFSMTALFVTVFVEQWLTTKNHLPALIGLGVSVICLLVFGAGSFLIPTMIAITLILWLMKPLMEKRAKGGVANV